MWPFRSTRTRPPVSTFATASTGGRLIYAVGDVHGRLDLLRRLVARIADDMAASAPTASAPMLVFLGDYIDRGDQSCGVIDMIIALRERSGFDVRCLKGNHEETLLAFLDDPSNGPAWGLFGGRATLKSYGVTAPLGADLGQWAAARDALAAALPEAHLRFFRALPISVCVGDYLFVHAGVRHGVALQDQSERDMLWIRDPFLTETRPFEKFVVHGHSPTHQPYFGPHRICVDTGAYATGVLTAARLLDAERGAVSSDRAACASSPPGWTPPLSWSPGTASPTGQA